MSTDKLRDLLLGYDDAARDATEEEMNLYFFLFGGQRARPAMFIDLARSIVVIREPRTEAERVCVRIAAAAIERAAGGKRSAL